MNFLRSLFGLDDSPENRTVLGNNVRVDEKEGAYIRNSNKRLTILFNLYNRYQETPHATKIQTVYEKTKNIHTYLIARKRAHALELFHVQHTDHFINTFTVIVDVYQSHQQTPVVPAYPPVRPPVLDERLKTPINGRGQQVDNRRSQPVVKPVSVPRPLPYTENATNKIARLALTEIWLNSSARIIYDKVNTPNGILAKEISFTSTKQEQDNFLLFVSGRLGIRDISYVGNAMVHILSNGANGTGIVPILYWQGFTYALNLKDNCLFPVRVNR